MPISLKPLWASLRASVAPTPHIDPGSLADPNPTTRWRTARRLRHHPRPDVLPILIHLLSDDDPILRDEVAWTLASWGAEHSLAPILDLLTKAPAPDLSISLLTVIRELRHPSARSVIQPFLDHTEPRVRAAAARALGAIATADDQPALLALVSDPDPVVRRAACSALSAESSALPALRQRLSDPDPTVAQLARRALARIQEEQARAQAKAATKTDAPTNAAA